MMKKFLILILVLGFASAASAALQMDIEVGGVDYAGEILAPGTTVTVRFVEDAAANTTGNGGTWETAYTGNNLVMTDTTSTAYYSNLYVPPSTDPPAGFAERGGWDWFLNAGVTLSTTSGDVRVSKSGAIGGNTPGTPGTDTIWREESTDYGTTWTTILGAPDIAVFAFDITATQTVAPVGSWNGTQLALSETIYIPEPMTIALLGLGGLLLRRRK
jgi:hypothetical protein